MNQKISADIHGLRELGKQIMELQPYFTPETYEQLQALVRKMERMLHPQG